MMLNCSKNNALMFTLRGIIERRLLINFRIEPGVARSLLPPGFEPVLLGGWAMGGVCLIRLKHIRPRGIPAGCGITSENAAHRIAVSWQEHGERREGVFISRRDTSSALQTFVGRRLFPGEHHLADFVVKESQGEFRLNMTSRDGCSSIDLLAHRATRLAATSIFASLAEASDFFARGSIGYSATATAGRYDGLELRTVRWAVEPVDVRLLKSSLFEDTARFPNGSVRFDCALLMRNVEHEWHPLPQRGGRI